MPPPKTHPNNGATMWASIPDHLASNFVGNVLTINSQVPEGHQLYVSDTKDVLADAVTSNKLKFHPEHVETWHARHIPGNSVVIGNNPWDKHPLFAGPEDTKVYVYDPKTVEQKVAEVRQKEWAEKEKAKIAAKATKDPQAVDGALAAGGPADPTLAIDDPTPAPKKAATKKTSTKKAASKKKSDA